MRQIDNLTDDANQTVRAILDDGSVVQITLNYRPRVQRWTMDVSHVERVWNGLELSLHWNLMRQWRNLIPFGIALNSSDGVDPVLVDDFSGGRCKLYVLNEADVENAETIVVGADE